jgi:cell wall-associated NlpC family hydrolase
MQIPLLTAVTGATATFGLCGVLALTAASVEPRATTPTGLGARPPICLTTGGISGLTPAQATNARTIYATAAARGGSPAAYIALMTALAESNLLVLSNPHDPAGNRLPAQGVGYDHDSLGLFQQRPSWGTAAQRMDPIASTNLFLDALLAVPGWTGMEPWRAAQTVQRSAYDGRPSIANHGSAVMGGNYLAQASRATELVNVIEGDGVVDCGGADPSVVRTGSEAGKVVTDAAGLAALGASTAGVAAVTFALAQRGKPYVWGGVGPNGYDCSGLMQTAWAHAGVAISRVSSTQLHDGTLTSVARLVPGDLVLIPGVEGTLASPGHIGMYIGNGLVVHAPRTGDVVKVTALSSFTSNGLSGYRHIR